MLCIVQLCVIVGPAYLLWRAATMCLPGYSEWSLTEISHVSKQSPKGNVHLLGHTLGHLTILYFLIKLSSSLLCGYTKTIDEPLSENEAIYCLFNQSYCIDVSLGYNCIFPLNIWILIFFLSMHIVTLMATMSVYMNHSVSLFTWFPLFLLLSLAACWIFSAIYRLFFNIHFCSNFYQIPWLISVYWYL